MSEVALLGAGRGSAVAPAFSPDQIPGLKLWLRADALALSDNDPVATWPDSSGEGNDATQATSGSRPTFKNDGAFPIVRFDGSDDFFDLPDFASGLTAGEIFIVVKIDADPPPEAQSGLWVFGSAATATHFPFSDGTVYDGFATDTRKTTVNPTPSLSAAYRLYNISSQSGEWTSRLDGTQIFTTGTNTVGWTTTPKIGKSEGGASYFFDGDLAEVIMYDSVLSSGNRDSVETYVADEYDLSF